MKKNLSFEEVAILMEQIGEQERHFNALEMEYRKLASHWLLVALGAIGFVLSKENDMPISPWILVICISISASIGIFVIWLLYVKVYHQLLHAAFNEGMKLENDYPDYIPPIRKNMISTQMGGNINNMVNKYYLFSIIFLITIATISIWIVFEENYIWPTVITMSSIIISTILFFWITKNSEIKQENSTE